MRGPSGIPYPGKAVLEFSCPRPERSVGGHLVVGSSVCLSVRYSIQLTNKVQYIKFE